MKKELFSKGIIYIFILMFLFSCSKKTDTVLDYGSGDFDDNIVINNSINVTSTGNTDISPKTEELSMFDKFNSNILGSIKCEIQTNDDGVLFNQVIYISGNKLRVDTILDKSSVKSENHMISDGEYSYVWGEGGSFKFKNSQSVIDENSNDNIDEKFKSDFTDSKSVLENLEENRCGNWNLDESVFELPSGIDFFDMNDLQKGLNVDFSNFQK
ncbi:MAG: hypothetical protein PHS49_01890 [Candidatus Gracilibacteria bacterium]|nr:hypothetical protein [Candidatus Gracilibacteria bacterium]